MSPKKDSRNRGFEEKAHLHINQTAYEDGYERIFGKKSGGTVSSGYVDHQIEKDRDWSQIAIDIQMEFNQYREQAHQDITFLDEKLKMAVEFLENYAGRGDIEAQMILKMVKAK